MFSAIYVYFTAPSIVISIGNIFPTTADKLIIKIVCYERLQNLFVIMQKLFKDELTALL